MTNHRKGIEMKVYTTEDATTKNCCVMIKRCCGNQCMAWETIGDIGYCGMVPKTQVKDTVQVMVTGNMSRPDGQTDSESFDTMPNSPQPQTNVSLGTIKPNMDIHGNELPTPQSDQETNHTHTLHKPNKQKGIK